VFSVFGCQLGEIKLCVIDEVKSVVIEYCHRLNLRPARFHCNMRQTYKAEDTAIVAKYGSVFIRWVG